MPFRWKDRRKGDGNVKSDAEAKKEERKRAETTSRDGWNFQLCPLKKEQTILCEKFHFFFDTDFSCQRNRHFTFKFHLKKDMVFIYRVMEKGLVFLE